METIEDSMVSDSGVPFKSYYVVWKLAPVIAPIAIGFCLNRTM